MRNKIGDKEDQGHPDDSGVGYFFCEGIGAPSLDTGARSLPAIVFAVLLVGSVTLATYFFVADGMARSAQSTTWRLTQVASNAVAKATTNAKIQAASEGLVGADREKEAQRLLLRAVPDLFAVGGVEEGAFAFYIRRAAHPSLTGVVQ